MAERRTPDPVDDGAKAGEPRRGLARGLDPSCFEERRPAGGDRHAEDLHVCPSCASELVLPVDWEQTRHKRAWRVTLRCPDCEWTGGGTYAQSVVDRFDEVLDDGTEAVLDDLRALTRANMEEQIERFVAALEADQVLPEDF